MINLRPYQQEAIDCVHNTFLRCDRQYIVMPTGSGKTITFFSIIGKKYKKVLIVVPSCELLRQVYETAQLFYHKSEISKQGDGHKDNPKKLHILIIHNVRNNNFSLLINQDFDLVIIDEAHHSQSRLYLDLMDKLEKSCNPKFLGVTATPERLDGALLKEVLYNCSYQISTLDLIRQKYLCDIEGLRIKTNINIPNLESRQSNFSIAYLYKHLATESRNNLIVESYEKEMKDRKCLIFCLNIEHSKEISRLLLNKKYLCCQIDSKMPKKKISDILSKFKKGEINCLINCQLLTEGFDEPSIDGIILARPTQSTSLFNQMIGRGLRICAGKKNCKILDIADNHRTLISFNSIIGNQIINLSEKDKFNSVEDIDKHIKEKTLEISEFSIERADILNQNKFENLNITESMLEYFLENNITYIEPLSFSEGSFLIWLNELKKSYANGSN